MVVAALKYNLANLLNFRGRESKVDFWIYAVVVLVLTIGTMAAVWVPEFSVSMERMQKFAVEHPELATVNKGSGSYAISIQGNHPELMPDMGRMVMLMAPMLIALVGLLAAAAARRLHDSGESGLWGLPPVLFLSIAFALMPKIFAADLSNEGTFLPVFLGLFVNNVLYLVSLAYLIVLLIRDGGKVENRFGPPSAR